MKSNFLATVAHEISTPLAVIAASSADTIELLKETPVNMKEIMDNHEMINKRVLLIDGIITDLMDTVAIENGRLSLSRQPVKLAELLQSVCDKGFKRLDANNNRVAFDLEENFPPIWSDPARIEQVMTNLLSNADRHTKDGLITVTLTRTEKGQTVSVADNGEGMEPEIAKAALKEYVTSKGENWRHGYGLYLCRQIILSHSGEIWINSERGRGTTVFFTLVEEDDD
jgi:signal transduction histidine kinase